MPGSTLTGFGGWETGEPLPQGAMAAAAFIHGSFIYLTGGSRSWYPETGHTLKVLMARLNPDASTGPWEETAPLPRGRVFHAGAGSGDQVYLVGGRHEAGEPAASEVLFARVDRSGRISTWQETTTLPGAEGSNLAGCRIFVHQGWLYLLKRAGSHYRAPIRGPAGLGEWERLALTPVGEQGGQTGGFAFDPRTKTFFAVGGVLTGQDLALVYRTGDLSANDQLP